MRYSAILTILVIGGCATNAQYKQNAVSSSSAIKSAEEAGAPNQAGAAYYLNLAKEAEDRASELAMHSRKKEAASLLLRAKADAELATSMAQSKKDKADAAAATNRIHQLQQDNQVSEGDEQ